MTKDIIGEACRIEYDEHSGRLFLVFEIKNEKFKNSIKKDWTKDIEFKLIGKALVQENDK